jgi:hypothetical protein
MSRNLPAQPSQRVAAFLDKVQASHRGRLIFALDATYSRQPTWDTSASLTAEMFMEAGKIGGLEIQLVYFRGLDECKAGQWTIDARALAQTMSRIACVSGNTQIRRVLEHARKEHAQQPVNAIVFIGDAMEESAPMLFDAAAGLPPLFLFQEGADPEVSRAFAEMARLTKGAHCKFSSGSARELAELLRAVAAFAVGGLTALQDQRTESARKLLGQMKKKGQS